MLQTARIHTTQFPDLHYRKIGQGSAMVLLHGFPESGDLWQNIWGELSRNFTLIIPDLPGAGQSSFGGDSLSIEQMAESVSEILCHEGIKEAVIAGHSMGGYTAFAFADKYPAVVKGLSLIHSTGSADTEEKRNTRLKAIELVKKEKGKEPFIRQVITNSYSDAFKKKYPEGLESQVQQGLKLEVKSIIAFYNAMIKRPDRSNILVEAKFPVQWIIGKDDTIAPFNAVVQQTKLADVSFISVYEDCGHMSMIEKPEMLLRDLNEFGQYCYN